MNELIAKFEQLIRRDPARRGLIGSESQFGPLCPEHLTQAATHLSEQGTHVGIVTGFFIPHSSPPAAETDGPLGSLLLLEALESVGMEVRLISDSFCDATLRAGCIAAGISEDRILEVDADPNDWLADFFTAGFGRQLTHLIAVERVGPSHTRESLLNQPRAAEPPVDRFDELVPVESRNHCHNMRGRIIDEYMADTSPLFERSRSFRPQSKTIGVGDGGNEIGMGSIPWEELVRRLHGDQAARIPCRIATDWNIVAGTSNWGAYALAAAVLHLRGRPEILRKWDHDYQHQLLQEIVTRGPAVDGVTGRQEPTVDGLPFVTYMQPWEGMRRLLGFHD